MTPLWALGYQQSRWGYSSDAEVREIGRRLRGDRIPADVIWMDIDYQDRYRPFTVDKDLPRSREAQPRPERRRASGLSRSPTSTSPTRQTNIMRRSTPGLRQSFRAQGGRLAVRRSGVAGPAVFPDFTRARRAMVGRALQGFHRRRLCRLLERHERAGGVRDPDQDHADRQSPPGRKRRFLKRAMRRMPRSTTSTGCRIRGAPSREWCGFGRNAALRHDPRFLCRRAALFGDLDRRQQLDLGSSAPVRRAVGQSRPFRLLLQRLRRRRFRRRRQPGTAYPLVRDRGVYTSVS